MESHELSEQDWDDIRRMVDLKHEPLPIGCTRVFFTGDDPKIILEDRLYSFEAPPSSEGIISIGALNVLVAHNEEMYARAEYYE